MPSYLDNLITPLFSLFIAGFLAFTVIGPIGREAGSLIAAGLTWLYDTLGFRWWRDLRGILCTNRYHRYAPNLHCG